MDEPIKPALTAEEWEQREYTEHTDEEGTVRFSAAIDPNELVLWWNGSPLPLRHRDKLAALCLYGQEGGFTREMLQALTHCLAYSPCEDGESWGLVELLQENLEALLPPEEK